VDFKVDLIDKSGDKVKLTAPGYGGHPYGNGAIYLTRGFAVSDLTPDQADVCPACGGNGRGVPTLQEPDGSEDGCIQCGGTGKRR
jgi:hypothetical protein